MITDGNSRIGFNNNFFFSWHVYFSKGPFDYPMRAALFAVGFVVVLGIFSGYRAMLGGYKNVELASNDVGVEGARSAVSDKVGFGYDGGVSRFLPHKRS